MRRLVLPVLAALAALLSCARAEEARRILDAAGLKGGLVAVLGCGDPALLLGLRPSDAYLVHGLDPDPQAVARARQALQERGAYGPITVSLLEGPRLPYADNLVNLLVVAEHAARAPQDERMRALAPGGVAVDAREPKLPLVRKPWPEGLDEWTHYLYDASNNAVSADRVVAPPRSLQWTCGPAYARSHEHFASVSALVSTGGRVFYIIDEGPISSVFLPPEWKLVARDAFSGVLLWTRPIADWESQLRGFRSGPPEIGRRLIATAGRVYVALGYGQPVRALDAATGKDCHVFAGTEGARELLCRDGVLYVLADDMTAADHNERTAWINQTAPGLRGYRFPREPIPMYGTQRLVALRAESGERLWRQDFAAPGEVLPATLAVAGGRVCLQTVSHVVCLDARSGREVWRSERPVARSRFSWSTPTLVVHDGVVLTVDRVARAEAASDVPERGSQWLLDNAHQSRKQDAELVAFSLQDGRELWRAPCFENYDTPLDLFVIGGVVWVGTLRHRGDPGFTHGRDLHSGKVVATLPHNRELYSIQMGHHRCHRNKATSRYLLLGRDGIEFVDLKEGTGTGCWWVRGTCQYGIMPANGLVYAPQHSCACHPAEKLNGFNVLSARPAAAAPPEDLARQLQQGPAYGTAPEERDPQAADWPTYRRDARRCGFQALPAPQKVAMAWTARCAPPLTPPVVADGKVFVAETDRHAVHAFSARDGARVWSVVADGRIDSPPTVFGGLCVFGTRSGFVYCLRAADGERVWRFRARPRQRLVFASEQLESAWPVHGSVLVDAELSGGEPVVYFAAGRSSHLDGGIRLYALELATGKVLHHADVTMAPEADGEGVIKERALPDVLSVQRGSLFMRHLRLDGALARQDEPLPHLYAPGGFLDGTWWHRTYWMVGTTMLSAYGGWPRMGNRVPAGRLLVFDGGETLYGYGRMAYRAGAGHVHPDATKDYRLFAEAFSPSARPGAAAKARRRGPGGRRRIRWAVELPFVARALVLTEDALLVAGGASLPAIEESRGPGTFWIAAREDGAKRSEAELPAPPVLDGMALAGSGVVVVTTDGAVVCLREPR